MLYLYVGMTLFGAVLKWVAIALVYNLDKKTVEQMQTELYQRRIENNQYNYKIKE